MPGPYVAWRLRSRSELYAIQTTRTRNTAPLHQILQMTSNAHEPCVDYDVSGLHLEWFHRCIELLSMGDRSCRDSEPIFCEWMLRTLDRLLGDDTKSLAGQPSRIRLLFDHLSICQLGLINPTSPLPIVFLHPCQICCHWLSDILKKQKGLFRKKGFKEAFVNDPITLCQSNM